MRSDDAADHVKCVLDARGPLAKSFIGRVLERLRAARDRMNLRAEQLHNVDVERLALDVQRTHEDVDRYAELRADRRRRHAVLPGTCLGDDPFLPHPLREQPLTDRVVDLVGARMIEILALEEKGRRVVRPDEPLCNR